MKFTKFIWLTVATLVLVSCNNANPASSSQTADTSKQYTWTVVTTWQKDFPLLGTSVTELARRIDVMSRGQLKLKVYGSGELVPAFEVFSAVSQGTAQAGHGAAYYWRGIIPSAEFFTAVPFGMTAVERAGWLYHGGGNELWRKVYDKHNVVPFSAGNTGTQWGGWYRKEINTLQDLDGLTIRMPGLGGEVISQLGAQQVLLPGAELYTALDTGVIDAAEWVGPANDLSYGFHQIAPYYYYPGWHEPGPTLEFIVNKEAWEELPEHLQEIVATVTQAMTLDMMAEYTARNQEALVELEKKPNVHIKPFPKPILDALKAESEALVQKTVASDAQTAEVYKSWKKFADQSKSYRAKAENYIEKTR